MSNSQVREAIKELEPTIDAMRQQRFLVKGVALGLFYGIIGNMFVSHYYEVFKGVVMWQLDKLFWTNLITLVIFAIAIIVVSWRFLIILAKLEGSVKAFERFKEKFLVE